MRGSKTNSTVVLSTQSSGERGGEEKSRQEGERGRGDMLGRMEQVKKDKGKRKAKIKWKCSENDKIGGMEIKKR